MINFKKMKNRFFRVFVIAMEVITLLIITGATLESFKASAYDAFYVFVFLLFYHVWRIKTSKIDPDGQLKTRA